MKFKTIVISAIFALSINVANAGEKLSLYHWFEYIPQELLDKFESETGIDVTMDTYDSNESLLAALKAGKLGSYDVAVPGDSKYISFFFKLNADIAEAATVAVSP